MDSFSYQALVSLNNIGAVLLQRNCFEEAYLTFMDALYVLENGVAPNADGFDVSSFRCSLQAMVACANMRLEKTHRGVPRNAVCLGGAMGSLQLNRLCRNTEGADGVLLDLRVLGQESIYLNFRFLETKTIHIDLTSAVVVYNFGLCNLKMSVFNRSEGQYFRQSGVTLIKHAYAALPPLPAFTEVDDFTSIVTMSIIALSFLMEVGTLSNEETANFREQLRVAQEGLTVFAAQGQTAAAA